MASVDSEEDNRGFAEKNAATFPILSDVSKQTSTAYGVLALLGYAKRWTFYIDQQGVVIKIDKDVNPATAGENLVHNLQALGVPPAVALRLKVSIENVARKFYAFLKTGSTPPSSNVSKAATTVSPTLTADGSTSIKLVIRRKPSGMST